MSDPTSVKHTFVELLVQEMSMITSSDLYFFSEKNMGRVGFNFTATVVSH